jgi:hypothetical protein
MVAKPSAARCGNLQRDRTAGVAASTLVGFDVLVGFDALGGLDVLRTQTELRGPRFDTQSELRIQDFVRLRAPHSL